MMKRTEIASIVSKAVDRLRAGDHTAALAELVVLQEALATPTVNDEPPTAADWKAVESLEDAYQRSQAGTITAAEVNELADRLAASPPPKVIDIARKFCSGLPARCSRAQAVRAIRSKLLGPIEATERATF